ncbi:MAG: hypothetical protein J1F12_02705 [Muribaculaceae bacterium]|nr:hypothetical protein [Muribaculaceae bacterium]
MKKIRYNLLIAISFPVILFTGCKSIDNERIPNMAVNISLSDAGLWNTYGVSGFGSHRYFILRPSGGSLPTGFPYKSGSATGFGGVLLIEGIDPINALSAAPLAYDLACPVESKRDIIVHIDPENYVAVCNECHSTYDVTMGGGAPISGIAATGKYKYGLKVYRCIPSGYGGYYITN